MASPPNSPSRTKEGSALRREYSLDRLEAQEQDFIQHIRTAGLRKPRETALVDELLAMRKERRQIFSALVGHIIRLQSTRLQLAEDVERHIAAQRDLRSAHQEELRKLPLGVYLFDERICGGATWWLPHERARTLSADQGLQDWRQRVISNRRLGLSNSIQRHSKCNEAHGQLGQR